MPVASSIATSSDPAPRSRPLYRLLIAGGDYAQLPAVDGQLDALLNGLAPRGWSAFWKASAARRARWA